MLLCWIVCSLASSPGKTLADLYPDGNLYPDVNINCHINGNSYLHTITLGYFAPRYAQLNANAVSHSHPIRHAQPFANSDRNHLAFRNSIQHAHLHSDDGTQPYRYPNGDSRQPYQLANGDRNPLANRDPDTDRDSQRYDTSAAYRYAVKAVQ